MNRLYVHSSTGQTVLLPAFATWSTVLVLALAISHQSQFPAATISFYLALAAMLAGIPLMLGTRATPELRRPLGFAWSAVWRLVRY